MHEIFNLQLSKLTPTGMFLLNLIHHFYLLYYGHNSVVERIQLSVGCNNLVELILQFSFASSHLLEAAIVAVRDVVYWSQFFDR